MAKYKEYTKGVYEDSDRLKDLNSQSDYWNKQQLQNFTWDDSMVSSNTQNWLNQLNALQKPTWDGYSRQSDWDNIVNKITNMKDFSYDVNGDALYQQYKDQYSTQGKMAMMDTMGQAAALTGGYGNSYAQSVGQQTYQGYMQQLADKVPELYSLALSKYNSDREDLYRQNDLHQNMFNNEYGMYRNDVSDYNTDRGYYSDMYNTGYARDYQTALDTNNSYNSNVASNRSYYTDAANQLANFEWGKYADNESLAQAAIQIYNDNLYKNEQLAESQRQFDAKYDYEALEEWYKNNSISNDSINVDPITGAIIGIEGYDVQGPGSASVQTNASVVKFKAKEGDNFKITIGDKTYKVENDGKVEDENVKGALEKVQTSSDNSVITYDGDIYVKSGNDYYIVGSRNIIGEWGTTSNALDELKKSLK